LAHRSVHYEAAFEDYLRSRGAPYVAVDEAKKAVFGRASVKSFDFIVYSQNGPNLLVDVNGRKFPDSRPGRSKPKGRAWENWATREDLDGLAEWERVFGAGFQGVLVFAYWLQGPPGRAPFEDTHVFRERHYAFVAVSLADYMALSRPRSVRWKTLAAPADAFSRLAKDFVTFL
jgi:hypothetical protein